MAAVSTKERGLKECLSESETRFLDARRDAALETEEGGDIERVEDVGVGTAEDEGELWEREGGGGEEAIEEREECE